MQAHVVGSIPTAGMRRTGWAAPVNLAVWRMVMADSTSLFEDMIGRVVIVRGTIQNSTGVELGMGVLSDCPVIMKPTNSGAYKLSTDVIKISQYRKIVLPNIYDAIHSMSRKNKVPTVKLGNTAETIWFHKSNTEIHFLEDDIIEEIGYYD